jgi:hypothetical protein
MRTCKDCGAPINKTEGWFVADKTGNVYCLECGEEYYDVSFQRLEESCRCSRGGNASTCECRG